MSNQIWNGDLFDRKSEALHLQRFIENLYENEGGSTLEASFVLNINASWGQGKTWFLTRLAQQLSLNHPVVYFDAWRNDFSKDALVSFVSVICDELSKQYEGGSKNESIRNVTATFGKVVKSALPKILGAAVRQVIGVNPEGIAAGLIADSMGESAEGVVDTMSSNLIEEFLAQKGAIEQFSSAVKSLTDNLPNDKHLPICVFVDELDRCRPTYAIELLEAIKHLFSISGIFFVLATNTDQLAHSVKSIYGSGFDAENYLKRFFFAEYNLRPASRERMSESLFFPLKSFFWNILHSTFIANRIPCA